MPCSLPVEWEEQAGTLCFGGPPKRHAVRLTFLTSTWSQPSQPAQVLTVAPLSTPLVQNLVEEKGWAEGGWGTCPGLHRGRAQEYPKSSRWSSEFPLVPPCPRSLASEGKVKLQWADIRARSGLRDHFVWSFLVLMETVTQRRPWTCSGFHSKSFQVPCKMLGTRGHREQK